MITLENSTSYPCLKSVSSLGPWSEPKLPLRPSQPHVIGPCSPPPSSCHILPDSLYSSHTGPSFYPSDRTHSLPPQGLCTGCSLDLDRSCARGSQAWLLQILQVSAQMSPPQNAENATLVYVCSASHSLGLSRFASLCLCPLAKKQATWL